MMFSRLKKTAVAFGVLACMMVPSHSAYAICETNAEVTQAQGNAITQQADKVAKTIADLQKNISTVLPVELTDLLGKISGFSESFRLGLGERANEWEDAMKAETAQEAAAIQDQTHNLLAAQSAQLHNDDALNLQKQEVNDTNETEYAAESCVFDTTIPHYSVVSNDVEEYTNSMTTWYTDQLTTVSKEVSPEYLAVIYKNEPEKLTEIAAKNSGLIKSAAAQSTDEELMAEADKLLGASPLERNRIDYDRYLNVFCNALENGGIAPCTENGSRVDDDIEISRTLFGKDTLDVEGMEDLLVLAAAVDNLTGRPRLSSVPRSALNGTPGRQQLLEKRASAAHLNASVGLIWNLISERLPASKENKQIGELRVASGVPESDISDRPSKYEFRQSYIEHVNSPPYIFKLKGNKDVMAQHDLHLKALRLMMMDELNARMERLSTMFAIQLSNQLSAREGND